MCNVHTYTLYTCVCACMYVRVYLFIYVCMKYVQSTVIVVKSMWRVEHSQIINNNKMVFKIFNIKII